MNIKKHLGLLGHHVRDKVTGHTGVVVTISFDLYGCIQAVVNPGIGKDGKIGESHWFDVDRLDRTPRSPVMEPPNYDFGLQADGKHGPAEKPAYTKP